MKKCPQQLIQAATPRHHLSYHLLYTAHVLLDLWRAEWVEQPEKPRAVLLFSERKAPCHLSGGSVSHSLPQEDRQGRDGQLHFTEMETEVK